MSKPDVMIKMKAGLASITLLCVSALPASADRSRSRCRYGGHDPAAGLARVAQSASVL